MDPLSVSASVIGLLGAGAKITSFLLTVVRNARDAPALARSLLCEMADIAAALGSLQAYLSGRAQAPVERGALILLEHVLTTLTGCVATYSDLQRIVDDLSKDPEMDVFDKLKWSRQEPNISVVMQRLQNHKSSLTLMLTILQCQTMQEAENSTRRLCQLVEEVMRSNLELAARIRGMEREGSIIAESTAEWHKEAPTIRQTQDAEAVSTPETNKPDLQFTFEQDLQASYVYNRAISRHSMTSLTSTALYTTALSVFSNLSLSQVSNISLYALPVYAVDLSNSSCYVFGEEGALQTMPSTQASLATTAMDNASNVRHEPIKLGVESGESQQGTQMSIRLLGRFSRRPRPSRVLSPISPPLNLVHVTHVGYDEYTSEFTGLPKEWKMLIGLPVMEEEEEG